MQKNVHDSLLPDCPWQRTLHRFKELDSTNTQAKRFAAQGAPHGTVIVADRQTGGRGRMGRSFSSPAGMGVYLSVLLRPDCTPDKLMHLTCAAGLAARNAVNRLCGIAPEIKWPNDLVINGKKLGGILTETALDSRTGRLAYAVVGIGINCCQKATDFPEDICHIATSLYLLTGKSISPMELSAVLTEELYRMDSLLLTDKNQLMADYRTVCITPGKAISIVQGDAVFHGTALNVDDDGGLVVQLSDGTEKTVNSGEVSIRGMYGYV